MDSELWIIAAGFISVPIVLFLIRRILVIPKLLKVAVLIMVIAGLVAIFLIGMLNNTLSMIN